MTFAVAFVALSAFAAHPFEPLRTMSNEQRFEWVDREAQNRKPRPFAVELGKSLALADVDLKLVILGVLQNRPVFRAATPYVAQLLDDPNPGVDSAARTTLERLNLGRRDRSGVAARALAQRLDHAPHGEVVPLLTSLWLVGPNRESIPTLERFLAAQDDDVRRAAARAMSAVDDLTPAVEVMLKAARDPDQDVRIVTLEALGRTRDPRALQLLLEATSAKTTDEQQGALRGLSAMGPLATSGAPIVASLFRSGDLKVRSTAATTLGDIGPLTRQELRLLVAAASTGRLSTHDFEGNEEAQSEQLNEIRDASIEALKSLGEPAAREVLQQLKTASPRNQRGLINLLCELRPPSRDAVPAIVAWMESNPPEAPPFEPSFEKDDAVQCLGDYGPDAAAAVDVLARRLAWKEERARMAALEALGAIGPKAAPAAKSIGRTIDRAVSSGKSDSDWEIAAGLSALARIGPSAAREARKRAELLNHRFPKVRAAAAAALLGTGADPAHGAVTLGSMLKASASECEDAARAAQSVAQHPKATELVGIMADALAQPLSVCTLPAAHAIAAFGGRAAAFGPAISQRLIGCHYPEDCDAICDALVKSGAREVAIPAFIDFLRKRRTRTRCGVDGLIAIGRSVPSVADTVRAAFEDDGWPLDDARDEILAGISAN